MTHEIQVLTVEGSKMEVFVFEPEGKGPFPGRIPHAGGDEPYAIGHGVFRPDYSPGNWVFG